MTNLPNKQILLNTFNHCINWEEKYSYIIELGSYLFYTEQKIRQTQYLVPGCQNKTWIIVEIAPTNTESIKLYGDSDSVIVKGIIAVIFIIYQEVMFKNIINFDPHPFLNQLQIFKNLTYSRSQGIESILCIIRQRIKKLLT